MKLCKKCQPIYDNFLHNIRKLGGESKWKQMSKKQQLDHLATMRAGIKKDSEKKIKELSIKNIII